MNIKGGSKILTMYWFIIILLVAGGIFAMVYSFYNYPYDVRELEGEVMINSVADCLSTGGEIDEALFEEGEFSESFKSNFLEECHLNLEVEEVFQKNFDEKEEIWQGNPQYYLKINFYNSTNLEESLFDISEGDRNLIADCNIQEEKEYLRTARCVEKGFFSFNGEDLYLIKILVAVKKTEKNVK